MKRVNENSVAGGGFLNAAIAHFTPAGATWPQDAVVCVIKGGGHLGDSESPTASQRRWIQTGTYFHLAEAHVVEIEIVKAQSWACSNSFEWPKKMKGIVMNQVTLCFLWFMEVESHDFRGLFTSSSVKNVIFFHCLFLFLSPYTSGPDSGLQPVCLLPDGSEWCGGSLRWSNATCPSLEFTFRVSLRSAHYPSHITWYNLLPIPGVIHVKFDSIT